jgi:hypothetical protein
MDTLVARLHIGHCRKALANEFDETKRQTLIRLIGEEELKLARALQKDGREKQCGPYRPSNAAAAQSNEITVQPVEWRVWQGGKSPEPHRSKIRLVARRALTHLYLRHGKQRDNDDKDFSP